MTTRASLMKKMIDKYGFEDYRTQNFFRECEKNPRSKFWTQVLERTCDSLTKEAQK